MFGRLSAIEGASADERGGRIALVDREGSNMVAIAEIQLTKVMLSTQEKDNSTLYTS